MVTALARQGRRGQACEGWARVCDQLNSPAQPPEHPLSILAATAFLRDAGAPGPQRAAGRAVPPRPPGASAASGHTSSRKRDLLAPVAKTFGGNSVCTAGLSTGSGASLHTVEPVASSCPMRGTREPRKLPDGGRKPPGLRKQPSVNASVSDWLPVDHVSFPKPMAVERLCGALIGGAGPPLPPGLGGGLGGPTRSTGGEGVRAMTPQGEKVPGREGK